MERIPSVLRGTCSNESDFVELRPTLPPLVTPVRWRERRRTLVRNDTASPLRPLGVSRTTCAPPTRGCRSTRAPIDVVDQHTSPHNVYGASRSAMVYLSLCWINYRVPGTGATEFPAFLSLRRSNRIPEHTTFWTFRERLTVTKARDTLCFEVVNRRPARLYGPVMGGSWMPVNWKLVRRRRKDTAAIRPQKSTASPLSATSYQSASTGATS